MWILKFSYNQQLNKNQNTKPQEPRVKLAHWERDCEKVFNNIYGLFKVKFPARIVHPIRYFFINSPSLHFKFTSAFRLLHISWSLPVLIMPSPGVWYLVVHPRCLIKCQAQNFHMAVSSAIQKQYGGQRLCLLTFDSLVP